MKKKLLFFAVAGLALASCSSDETVNSLATSEANEINFRAFTTGLTRATDATISNLASFTVDAYKTGTISSASPVKYFENVAFNKVDATQTYTSSTKYYWPSSYNLDFFAYGYASTNNTGITKNDYNEFTVVTESDPDNQVDLLYARSENWGKIDPLPANPGTSPHFIDGTPEGVTLNFRHTQSQIIIKLLNSNSNLKFTVNSVSVGNLKDRGKVTILDANTDASGVLSSATWDTSISGVANITYSTEATAATVVTSSAAQAGKSLILIPQTLPTPATTYEGTGNPKEYTKPYILIDLKIQNNATGGDAAYIVGAESGDNEYVTAMWPMPNQTWAPGYKYIYIVDLAGGGYYPVNHESDDNLDPILKGAEIKFVSVTVDTWANGGDTNVNNN